MAKGRDETATIKKIPRHVSMLIEAETAFDTIIMRLTIMRVHKGDFLVKA